MPGGRSSQRAVQAGAGEHTEAAEPRLLCCNSVPLERNGALSDLKGQRCSNGVAQGDSGWPERKLQMSKDIARDVQGKSRVQAVPSCYAMHSQDSQE